jgi:MFS family permease
MEQRTIQRIFLSVFFFVSGIAFASWASRIPTIKAEFGFNEAELGTILLAMPIASLMGLPVSGFLVARFDSRVPLAFAFIFLSLALALIGFASSTFALVAAICLFSFCLRILNISMNTQALTLQKLYPRKINGSFHGLWSTGGIVGVAFSTLMVSENISMQAHLAIVAALTLVITFISYRFLIKNDRSSSGNKLQLSKPDPYIVYLGMLAFLSAICEGGMFDWNGIYFKEVVGEEIFTLGYLLFMVSMAISRFASDYIVEHFGMPATYFISAFFICTGITTAVVFPTFWPVLVGFCLTGFGTASIIPVTFLLAGGSKKYSAGTAISVIATYGIVGMLIGPPIVGYIAHATSLRVSFVLFAIGGLMLIPISQLFFRHQRSIQKENIVQKT